MAMSFQALNLAGVSDTDANFRSWGSGISAAIAAVGLIQTADTAQINWTTVLAPSTTNQKRGYEMWRFNDGLQATRPIFIRLDYGSGPNIQYNPQIWLTVGTATDGAGNVTANASFPNSFLPVRTMFMQSNVSWYAFNGSFRAPFYVSSDGAGSLLLAGWMNNPNVFNNPTWAGGLMLVERTRDWDGTPNGEGALTITSGGNQNPSTQVLIIGNAATYTQGNAWTGVPAMAGGAFSLTPKTGMSGSGVINLYPVFTGGTPQMNGPSKHVVAVWAGDVPGWSRFPLSIYGESGTFVSLGTTFPGWETNALALCGAFRVA